MNPKYFRTLEFDKILGRLAAHTAFSASEHLARALTPSTDADEIARRQGETAEARALLDQHPETSVGGARDVRPLTKNARLGALLSPIDLLEIRQTLLAARTLRRTLARLDALYPRLAARALDLQELPALVDAVARAVNDRGEILDSASPRLARIRRDLNTARARLMDKLQRIISSSAYARILQEPIITQRDGRYVVPIRAEAKGRLQGILHDTSASGATLFIEPLSVVELGNRARELEREEEREVEHILRELTGLVGAHADAMDATVETLAEIDLAFAKAKYAAEIRGVEPVVASAPAMTFLDLRDARHPLLDPDKVVPISIHLGKEFSILIITGPNTGGKTVTLKTVGLLALMAQSGLPIPAGEGSRLPVFSGVYADIGDEQSIEQSLSTFSSHLRNIVEILREADERSVVLLDELGAGTDPVEGSALARAILVHLLERKIPALVATHYAELKAFAHARPGVQNASVEFDLETLSPTFYLTMGLPGQSNAFAIASRLGLDSAIIERARGVLARGNVEMETMLAEIKRARQEAAAAQAHAELAQREAEKLAADARRQAAELEKSRAEILERTRAEAQAEIEKARAELSRLRQEWRTVSLTREFVESEQAKLEEIAESLIPTPPPPSPQPSPFQGEGRKPHLHRTQVQVSRGGSRGGIESDNARDDLRKRAGVGDRVWVSRLGRVGEVVAIDAEGADVQVGSFRVHLKTDELQVSESRQVQVTSRVKLPEVESPGIEVSLRGLRADDALAQLEKYLDRAYLAGLPYVRIVHGKGTGTLRKLARDLLREHPLVAEIREAEPHEGGEGVTIAKLVSR